MDRLISASNRQLTMAVPVADLGVFRPHCVARLGGWEGGGRAAGGGHNGASVLQSIGGEMNYRPPSQPQSPSL